jgi:hypothetical protein
VYLPGKDQPVVWPSQDGAADVVSRYKAVPKPQRMKNKLDSAEVVRERVDKAKAELYNLVQKNCEMEMNLLNFFADRRVGASPTYHRTIPPPSDGMWRRNSRPSTPASRRSVEVVPSILLLLRSCNSFHGSRRRWWKDLL